MHQDSTRVQRQPLDRRMIIILLIIFVQLLIASMVLPILPLYAQRTFNMQPLEITLLVASFFAFQFLAGPTIGRLSDRYGRVPVLIVSQIGTIVSFIMLIFAASPWMLFASRILDGITGGNIIVAQAYVTDITPRENRTAALGLTFAAFGLGFIFGPALGGILSAAFGSQMTFLVAAIAAAIPAVMTWLFLDETITPEKREQAANAGKPKLGVREVIVNRPLLLILAVAFGGTLGLGMLQATFALYGQATLFSGYSQEATDLGIGILLGLVGLGQLITQLFILRRLLKRFGDAKLVVIGTVIRSIAMLIYAVALVPFVGGLASLIFATGSGLMMPPLQSLTTYTVSDEIRGGVLGWYQSSVSLATIVGTAVSGALFELSPRVPYFTAAVLFALMLIPALYLVRWSQRQADRAALEVNAPQDEDALKPAAEAV
jgi:MFS transporter, DHA1 family, tetracycline resistance protein